MFQRRKYDLESVLDRLLQRLSQLGKAEALGRTIVDTLQQTLYADHVTLCTLDAGGERTAVLAHAGQTQAAAPDVPARLLPWLRAQREPIELESLDALLQETDLRAQLRAYAARTGTAIVVPLSTGGEFVGWLQLSPKTNLRAYHALDLALLRKLRVEAAIALANAALYDRVGGLNEELTTLNTQLEAKVRGRTGELEAANHQLAESNKQIAEADRAKTQFLANISHELRTPLNAIIGFSRLLLKEVDGALTPKQREDLLAVHHSGSHLLGLISDLLDLSKIVAGKMELTVETVDLAEMIRGVMTTAQALVREHPAVELHATLDPQLPTLQADPLRLRQVVLNLVSNAVKATERGEVEVRAEQRGAYVVVSVRDTGVGIRPEDQSKLFQEFRQLDGSQARGGTGLGLAISKQLVGLHGGEIWVESQVGEGSTFAFSLPLKAQANGL